MEDITLISGDGIGGQLLAFQIADLLTKIHNKTVKIYCGARDEVYKPLKYLFGNKFNIEQTDEGVFERVEDLGIQYKNAYLVWPDLLYRHKNSFDYKKYSLPLETIRDHKLLLDTYNPKNIIYCALNTSTDIYQYNQKWELIKQIALKNPDYIVHYNCIDSWNGKQLNNFVPENLPSNCKIFKNNNFIDEIEIMRQSCYAICIDNGPSHILHTCFGVPRTLLDTRMTLDGLMFVARWREDIRQSVGYHYEPSQIAELIKLNLEIPQTTLIPRQVILNNLSKSWKDVLFFKY